MKIFDVVNKVDRSGEYILGEKDTGSHACYMIYGILMPGEHERELCPGPGHEELILAVRGDLDLVGSFTGTLHQGRAIHLSDTERVTAGNSGFVSAIYLIAGGHAGGGHQ